MPELRGRAARIRVIGVGGAGSNAVERMYKAAVQGVEFLAANTDLQDLESTECEQKIQLGEDSTRGLGAGGDPEIGLRAAEESRQDVKNALDGSDMVFITCGMGGGTGTGASPVVAEVCRELGSLTVAVVTKPFSFERGRRAQIADDGIERLKAKVDSIITISNDRLLDRFDKTVPILEAFRRADEVLRQGVQGISDLITMPGLINLDFADVKNVLAEAGIALMGIGEGTGEHRAADAANAAISSPLLELPMEGARRILLNIAAGEDLAMSEAEEAAQIVAGATTTLDTNVFWGLTLSKEMGDLVRITVIATGFGGVPEHREPVQAMAQQMAAQGESSSELEIPSFLRKR
jgi:cell division protein FtsZ